MVKLPDATDLPYRAPRASRPQPQYPTSSPVAEALQGFGNTLARVGFSAAQENRGTVEKTQALGVQSRFLQFEDQWSKASIDRAQQANPGAAGFVEGLKKDYQESAKEFFKSIPDDMKPQFDVKLFDLESRLTDGASRFEREEMDRYATQQISDGQNVLLNRQAANPEKWKEIEQEGEELIRNNPARSPIEADAEIRAWRKRRAMQLFETRRAQDETGTREALGVAKTSSSLVDRIVQVESGGNPNAKASTSSATGLGQFTSGTWSQFLKEKHPELIRSARDHRTDPDLSREAVQWYADKNAGMLRAKGLPVTAGTLYLSHFLGPQGAADMLAANQMKTAASVNPAAAGANKSIFYNKDGSAKSASDIVAWAERKMGGTASAPIAATEGGTAPSGGADISILSDPDPEYAALDFEDRLKLYERSVQAEEKRGREEAIIAKTQIETAADNAPAAIMATGSYDGPLPEMEQFVKAYGEEGPQRYEAFQASVEASETVFKMQAMPAAEIQQAVTAATPVTSGDGAAIEAKQYQVISSAAETTLKAREQDPAAYVQKVFPAVAEAWQQADSEGGFQRAISASVAAQEQLGVSRVQPLPKPIVQRAVADFKDTTISEEQRFGSMAQLVTATSDRKQRRAIFDQMTQEGLPETVEGAVLALERGDDGAARRLFQAATTDIAALPGKLDATPSEIDQAIQDNLLAEGEIGDLYYGITGGLAENLQSAQRDSKLLKNAVILRLRSGESLDAAVAGAAKDLFGDVQPVVDDNVQILLPTSADPDAAIAGLQALLPRVKRALQEKTLSNGRQRPFRSDNPIVNAALAARIDDVMANGFFRNSGDGYVFIDPYDGEAVTDVSNNPIIYRPAPVVPVQTPVTGDPLVQTDPGFEQRTPLLGAGPSLDAEGNPVELGQ